MHEEASYQTADVVAFHRNSCPKEVNPSEHNLNPQFHDSDHEQLSYSVPPPIFTKADDIDADVFNANLSAFFYEWIPATVRIFKNIGPSIFTREFWSSQIRTELDHRLWQNDFLGREATEEELDWIVDNAMRIYWPRIQDVLHDRESEMRSGYAEPARASVESRNRKKKAKSRRTVEVEDMLSHMCIEEEAGEGQEKRLKIHRILKDGYGWEDLEYETNESMSDGRCEHNGIEKMRIDRVGAHYREMSVAGEEGPDRELEMGTV